MDYRARPESVGIDESELDYERAVVQARARASNEAFARAWAEGEGRAMTLEQAVTRQI